MKVTINGTLYALSVDGDVTDDGRAFSIVTWDALPPPACPDCGESLGAFCDETSKRASIHVVWTDELYVECDNCGAYFPIDDAPPLKAHSQQADGYHEPSLVEDDFGDDRS